MKINKATKYSISIVTFALATVLLVAFIQQYTIYTLERNAQYQGFVNQLHKNQSVLKAVADKRDVNALKQTLQSYLNFLNAFYSEKETGAGQFKLDNEMRLTAKEAIGALELFQNEIASRVAKGATEEPDWIEIALAPIHASTIRLQESIQIGTAEDHRFINMLSWYSVALLVMGFMVLSLFMIRYMRRTRTALLESEVNLKNETARVSSLSKFIESVSKGDYNIQLDSKGAEDHLTDMLISMRESLKENAESERRRNWSTSGLAKIGEILRGTGNTSILYDNIIQFVVKYTKSNQGGLFILNDDDENNHFLELVSCYAFERKKFIQKKIDPGQGIIGQCFLEAQRVYLLEVPEDYIQITSGLGSENPSALLLIPMKVNEKVFGVIELASFNKYEEFEIALVEEFAESIASTISTVKTNESTRILLEQTQQQAEEMRSQEEEMRQNMEELSATQEEMGRKEKEYIARIEVLEAKLKTEPADSLK